MPKLTRPEVNALAQAVLALRRAGEKKAAAAEFLANSPARAAFPELIAKLAEKRPLVDSLRSRDPDQKPI